MNRIQDDDRKQKIVLIVDDMPDNLTVLGELLMPYYHVRIANSGSRALAAATSEPRPNLILLDIMMPDIDGYEVLKRLKASEQTRDIPIVFVTALDSTEDEALGLELGAADYISKPIRPAIVLARIRGQLELTEARDLLRDNNAWLEREIKLRMHHNQIIQDASMRALASLAETRDNETGYHILRTQSYVALLCEELSQSHYRQQLTERYIELIIKAAPLHDIGKVGMPDHILLKSGKLTDAEWLTMRTHTTLGAEAIKRAIEQEEDQSVFDFLHVAIDIACYHHEKWDGSGYPEGLEGEAIPLPARLMALADVFDALVNRRCYKDSMAPQQAIEIITAGKGTHFDPYVVDAFLARQADFLAVARRYADNPIPIKNLPAR